MNGQVIDYVRRPRKLEGRTDVFGLYVVEDSMSPRWDPGDPIFVEANRAPSIGDYVVVELYPDDGSPERPAHLKKLIRVSGSKIIVEQHNPPKRIEYDRRQVLRLYRVIPYPELLG